MGFKVRLYLFSNFLSLQFLTLSLISFFIVNFDVVALRCKEPLNILSWHKQNDSRCSDKSLYLQQVGDNTLSALDAIYVYVFFCEHLLLYLNMNTFLKKNKTKSLHQSNCLQEQLWFFNTCDLCFLNINYNWILPKH